MKEIICGWQKWTVLVDDDDYEYYNKFKWSVHQGRYTWYARRKQGRKLIYMHRDIMQSLIGTEVDHKNGRGYDNRRSNLHNSTRSKNAQNAVSTTKISKGVFKHVRGVAGRKYWARIMKDYITYDLGFFETEKEASIAYNIKAIELFGESARLNIIEDTA